ncbi:Transforming RhoA-like protein [Cladobotryum mycophilum]|uniref:Transforming RhoA-like protein n=1 Tax=Cladobotryum mycophilum TaxID=491253 RepID=A0ABR0SZT7_9HYPO
MKISISMSPDERAESIDSWRHSVPSRLEREDPFANDGFGTRPSTRLTFRDEEEKEQEEKEEQPTRRPSTRLSFFRVATPLFGRRSSNASNAPPPPQAFLVQRPETALGIHEAESRKPKRRGFLSIFSRKRKRGSSSPPPALPVMEEPVRLQFLFVGARCSGQTSLLFRARYGYFPDDTSGVPDLRTVERLSYIPWDAIFLCFDIKDKVSMHTILQWWRRAVDEGFNKDRKFEPLLHLVGMKRDVRDMCRVEDHMPHHDAQSLAMFPTCCVSPTDATWQAKRIGAHRYLECSAYTGEGIEVLLEEAGQEAMRRAITRARGGSEDVRMAPGKRRLI